jgi:hypothetical protein
MSIPVPPPLPEPEFQQNPDGSWPDYLCPGEEYLIPAAPTSVTIDDIFIHNLLSSWAKVPGSITGDCHYCGREVWIRPADVEWMRLGIWNVIFGCTICVIQKQLSSGIQK